MNIYNEYSLRIIKQRVHNSGPPNESQYDPVFLLPKNEMK